MSMAVISLDTEKRICTLTLDGALALADSIYFNKGKDYDGNDYVSFGYMVTRKNQDGMTEMVEYVLPKPEMNMDGYLIEKTGLASKIIDVTKGLIEDVKNFLNNRKS